ncbi:MAG: hypothetical protein ONB13_01065 [candidate division KSB1 bacterium]|nr:hypothetical protein [candidate division KSB1 bacterium]MDZ7336421.1 hypothetical protein [candidate division KSB1 bacterium]MDZ7358397.1 hypothetical protein [candidate division KSB1 bacterium]MDZ7375183.1 hypothetical protein [candidate division KSB1 bacterium]MDZ7399059.1 hypothetical protein [candidate division KSB1 bacterium]
MQVKRKIEQNVITKVFSDNDRELLEQLQGSMEYDPLKAPVPDFIYGDAVAGFFAAQTSQFYD